MGKRELSFRKKKKNKNKKKNKFSNHKRDENFINEKENFNEKKEMPRNLSYETFISKLKENKKYPKTLQYLSLFVSNKSEWKFNVIFYTEKIIFLPFL